MTSPQADRSALWAAILLWAMAVLAIYLLGIEVTDDRPRRWLGHWIAIIWAAIGWLPILLFLRREPQPPEDHQ